MKLFYILLYSLFTLCSSSVSAQSDKVTHDILVERVKALERDQMEINSEIDQDTHTLSTRIDELEEGVVASAIGLFLSGILCALWAQYTRRSALGWFLLGVFFAPIALVAVVWKNALGLASGELVYWTKE